MRVCVDCTVSLGFLVFLLVLLTGLHNLFLFAVDVFEFRRVACRVLVNHICVVVCLALALVCLAFECVDFVGALRLKVLLNF